jgi:hypothetical protein
MALANVGLPGVDAARTVTPRDILWTDVGAAFAPGFAVIEGASCRDAGNGTDIHVLRAGYLLSRDPNDSDKYKGTIVGTTTANSASDGTSITVSAADATEINRRYGSSGSGEFYIVSHDSDSPSESTSVNYAQAVEHSAINTTTGVITCTALSGDNTFGAGSLLIANEAVRNIVDENTIYLNDTFILYDRYGTRVTNESDTSVDVGFAKVLVAGQVNTSYIVKYPTNVVLRNWLKGELRNGKALWFSDEK